MSIEVTISFSEEMFDRVFLRAVSHKLTVEDFVKHLVIQRVLDPHPVVSIPVDNIFTEKKDNDKDSDSEGEIAE
jgi:hypothetical protein